MEGVDPYAVMRNTETLQAFRARNRAAFAAGEPFRTLALVISCIFPVLFVLGPLMGRLAVPSLAFSALLAAWGLCFAVAGIKTSLYLRRHPWPGPKP